MNTLKHFRLSEFDSPDDPGSGSNMNRDFLDMLDRARSAAGIPFRISSGYRTQSHHDHLTRSGYKTAKNSAHLEGYAADIICLDSRTRSVIVRALIEVGFNRIGIGSSFVHVDDSPSKTEDLMWLY